MKLCCDFCYRCCFLEEEQVGFCQMRKNEGGKLVTLYYGSLVALAVDPVEKKPLYHFLPSSRTLSLAMFGCNLRCSFCQNYTISQAQYRSQEMPMATEADTVVNLALQNGCPSISFTYSEPLVWQDYMIEVAVAAKKVGLKTVMVSNGTFSTASLERLVPLIDAFNIDLKGDEVFYHTFCKASGKPVIDGLKTLAKSRQHLEVTTMVMQNEHTVQDILMLKSILASLEVQVWHLSRYFPAYKERLAPTEQTFLKEVLSTVQDGSIPFIYGGNTSLAQHTYCPACHALLLQRDKYSIRSTDSFKRGRCLACSKEIYGSFPS